MGSSPIALTTSIANKKGGCFRLEAMTEEQVVSPLPPSSWGARLSLKCEAQGGYAAKLEAVRSASGAGGGVPGRRSILPHSEHAAADHRRSAGSAEKDLLPRRMLAGRFLPPRRNLPGDLHAKMQPLLLEEGGSGAPGFRYRPDEPESTI